MEIDLRNEISSVAYWYALDPTEIKAPPTSAQRMPVKQDRDHNWIFEDFESNHIQGNSV